MEANNDSTTYYFPDQYLVVAYALDEAGKERPAGIFLTHPDETFTKQELLGYFKEVKPLYLIAAEIPEIKGLTMNNYHSKLSDLISDIYEKNLDDLDIRYYIPTTIH